MINLYRVAALLLTILWCPSTFPQTIGSKENWIAVGNAYQGIKKIELTSMVTYNNKIFYRAKDCPRVCQEDFVVAVVSCSEKRRGEYKNLSDLPARDIDAQGVTMYSVYPGTLLEREVVSACEYLSSGKVPVFDEAKLAERAKQETEAARIARDGKGIDAQGVKDGLAIVGAVYGGVFGVLRQMFEAPAGGGSSSYTSSSSTNTRVFLCQVRCQGALFDSGIEYSATSVGTSDFNAAENLQDAANRQCDRSKARHWAIKISCK